MQKIDMMKVGYVMLSIFVITLFLMQSAATAIAKNEEGLAKAKYKYVEATLEHIEYDEIHGMVKNGSMVTLSVELTNFSKEIESSYFTLYSDLKEPTPGITIDGVSEKINLDSPFLISHREVKEVKITLTGKAPEVNKRENITLLSITQKIKEKYSVLEVKRDVTSELIEKAITKIDKAGKQIEKANKTIANAKKRGIDTSDVEISLENAKLHKERSWDAYHKGNPKKALEEAKNASYFAMHAEEKAKSLIGSVKLRNYAIISGIIGIVIFALLFLYIRRRKEKRRL